MYYLRNFSAALVYLIQAILAIIGFFLLMRLLLRLLGANQEAPFVQWIYNTSQSLLVPFEGIFPTMVTEGRFVIEFSTLFAIIAYSIIGYLLIELILYIERASRPPTD